MQTLDMALRQLYQKNIISREEVLKRAYDPETILPGGTYKR
jgi:Tfp pilus assembly ATPase PilU